MNPPAHLSKQPTAPSSASRALLCGLSLSALVLGLQASAPLKSAPTAPALFNWTLLLMIFLGAGELFRRGDAVNRVTVAFVFAAVLQVLTITHWFQVVSNDHLASLLSARLSTTWHGAPTTALFQAWCALGVGWLSYQALQLAQLTRHRLAEPVIIAVSAFTALVGVRAVIGYATGSTSLLSG